MIDTWRQHLPTRAELAEAMRLLRRPGWWGAAVAVAVLSVSFVQLGEWQHARYVSKALRNSIIDAHYLAEPVPLTQVLATPRSVLDPHDAWQPTIVEGSYRSEQLLVRNRSLGQDAGMELLAGLQLDDGSLLVVDRGWLPLGREGGVPDVVPPPPSGRVRLIVRLVPSEPAITRSSPQGQVQRVDLSVIYRTWQAQGPGAFGVLAGGEPAGGVAPTLLPRPDEDLGPHLGYAWQWWIFAVASWGIWAYQLLQEARRRVGGASPQTLRPVRGTRGRISDEEWEDALTQSGDPVRLIHLGGQGADPRGPDS